MKPLIAHSFTALDTFINKCERSAFYRWIAKLVEPPSHYLAIGCFYHDAIAASIRTGRAPTREELAKLLAQCQKKTTWMQDIPNEALLAEVEENLRQLWDEVLAYLTPVRNGDGSTFAEQWATGAYCAKLDYLSQVTPLLNEYGEVIGTKAEQCIIDWKVVFSAKKKRSQYDADESMQLAIYALSVPGVRNAGFCEIPREIGQPIRLVVTTFSDYDLARWATYFREQFAALDSRGPNADAWKLAAPGHPLCSPRWCPYWKTCPRGEGK